MASAYFEGVAEELLVAVEVHPPVSAFAIAHWCGMTVATPACRDLPVRGAAMYFDATDELAREEQMARNLADWRLRRRGLPFGDEAVEYVARALLLPRAEFVRDVRVTRDVAALQRKHHYASARFIERRIEDIGVQLQLVSGFRSSARPR